MNKTGKLIAAISAIVLLGFICLIVIRITSKTNDDQEKNESDSSETSVVTYESEIPEAENYNSDISFYEKKVEKSDKYEEGATVYTDGDYEYYFNDETGYLYMIMSRDSSVDTIDDDKLIEKVSGYIEKLYPGILDDVSGKWVIDEYDNIQSKTVSFKADAALGPVDIIIMFFSQDGVFSGGNIFLEKLNPDVLYGEGCISKEEAVASARELLEAMSVDPRYEHRFENQDLSCFAESNVEYTARYDTPMWIVRFDYTGETGPYGYVDVIFVEFYIDAYTGEQVGEIGISK